MLDIFDKMQIAMASRDKDIVKAKKELLLRCSKFSYLLKTENDKIVKDFTDRWHKMVDKKMHSAILIPLGLFEADSNIQGVKDMISVPLFEHECDCPGKRKRVYISYDFLSDNLCFRMASNNLTTNIFKINWKDVSTLNNDEHIAKICAPCLEHNQNVMSHFDKFLSSFEAKSEIAVKKEISNFKLER